MKIPLEHFTHMPAASLTPRTSSHYQLQSAAAAMSSTTSSSSRNTAGSAPSSPELRKKRGTNNDSAASNAAEATSQGPASLSVYTGHSQQPKSLEVTATSSADHSRKKVSKEELVAGSELQVCTDCREMVLQVIRAQTTANRFRAQQCFFSNLGGGSHDPAAADGRLV